jgi:NADH-quinone oxidoreductase subunit M
MARAAIASGQASAGLAATAPSLMLVVAAAGLLARYRGVLARQPGLPLAGWAACGLGLVALLMVAFLGRRRTTPPDAPSAPSRSRAAALAERLVAAMEWPAWDGLHSAASLLVRGLGWLGRRGGAVIVLAALGVSLTATLWPGVARAASGEARVTLDPSPIRLDPLGQPQVVTVRNQGGVVVQVTRTELAPGSSPALRVTRPLRPGTQLAPGESTTLEMSYSPPPNQPPPQAFGSLRIEGHVGQGGTQLLAHTAVSARQGGMLSLLLLWTLAAAGLLLVVRARHLVRLLAVLGTVPPLLMGVAIILRFDRGITLLAGNGGLQEVERRPWLSLIGSEYLVGIDGLSVLPLLLVTLAAALAGLLLGSSGQPRRAQLARLLALEAAALAQLVVLDLFLMVATWLATLPLLHGLQAGTGTSGERDGSAPTTASTPTAPTPRRVLLHRLLAAAAVLVGAVLLQQSAPAGVLADGTPVAHRLDLPALIYSARPPAPRAAPALPPRAGTTSTRPAAATADTADAAASAALTQRRVAWALLVLGLLGELALFPLHAWRARLLPGAGRVLSLAVLGMLAPWPLYALLRVATGALPEAARWGQPALLVLGLAGLGFAVLRAVARPGAGDRLATLALAHGATLLLGLAAAIAATARGTASAQLGQTALNGVLLHAFVAGLALTLRALGSPARAPARLGQLALLAVPGLGPFLGLAILLLGVVPFHPLAAAAAVLLWVALGLAAAGVPEVPSAPPPDDRGDDDGDGEGAAGMRTAALLGGGALLALALVVLGVYPLPVLDLIKGTASDLLQAMARTAGP